MPACLYCGKKIESDYLTWKGGASRAICEECQKEEKEGYYTYDVELANLS